MNLFVYWVLSKILQEDLRLWAYMPTVPILKGGKHVHVGFRRWKPKGADMSAGWQP